MTMKLYMHPASTASRPVRLFVAEKKIQLEEVSVDLMTGEHFKEEFTAINPSRMVPALVDGDFRLTESSAILKFLASETKAPEYPTDNRKRAKVDEAMDWFNTQFYRDFGYGLLYPQIFPHHKRPSDEFQNGHVKWGKEKAQTWFGILDKNIVGSRPYVTGDQITIADYFGACIVTAGELIGCTYEGHANVQRWLGNMKKLASWPKINEVLYGLAASMKGKEFVNV